MLTTSVIIPTYHRPADLAACMHSLLYQTRLPDEIIIVDDGNLPGPPLAEACRRRGVTCRYTRKAVPGLTESRNLGVSMARGDIVFFLDDDVVLFPDYIEKILAVYAADGKHRIGGVGGAIANAKPLGVAHRLRRLLDIVFLVSWIREGRVLPSGFCTSFDTTGFPLRKVCRVAFLSGGVCSFRKEVFRHFSFTENYRRQGFGEDKDFSHRVSRRYALMFTPHARLYHLEAPSMRPDAFVTGEKFIVGRYLFFRDYCRKGWWSWIFFWYAVFGYTLVRGGIALFSFRRRPVDHLRGILHGLKAIRRIGPGTR